MNDYITIPLSKNSKYFGQFEAIVSDEDKDLANSKWNPSFSTTDGVVYFIRSFKVGDGWVSKGLHRVILERMLGRTLEKGQFVDHIDGNGLNNVRSNLRLATHSQNLANRAKEKGNKSGYKGVVKKNSKWLAQITYQRRTIRLGLFYTPEEAHAAYCKKAKELFGDFFHE